MGASLIFTYSSRLWRRQLVILWTLRVKSTLEAPSLSLRKSSGASHITIWLSRRSLLFGELWREQELIQTYRYTDFLVNEIMLNGTVVHLTDDKAPKFQPSSQACLELYISALDSLASHTADHCNRMKIFWDNPKRWETLLRLRMYVFLTDVFHVVLLFGRHVFPSELFR